MQLDDDGAVLRALTSSRFSRSARLETGTAFLTAILSVHRAAQQWGDS